MEIISKPEGGVNAGHWWSSLTGPVVALIVSGLLLGLAFGLDLGTEAQRDAALLVGTVTLYVITPLSVIWTIAVLWARFSRNRAGSGVGNAG